MAERALASERLLPGRTRSRYRSDRDGGTSALPTGNRHDELYFARRPVEWLSEPPIAFVEKGEFGRGQLRPRMALRCGKRPKRSMISR